MCLARHRPVDVEGEAQFGVAGERANVTMEV